VDPLAGPLSTCAVTLLLAAAAVAVYVPVAVPLPIPIVWIEPCVPDVVPPTALHDTGSPSRTSMLADTSVFAELVLKLAVSAVVWLVTIVDGLAVVFSCRNGVVVTVPETSVAFAPELLLHQLLEASKVDPAPPEALDTAFPFAGVAAALPMNREKLNVIAPLELWSIAPPCAVASVTWFDVKVLFVTVAVEALEIAPPRNLAVLPVKVLFETFSAPLSRTIAPPPALLALFPVNVESDTLAIALPPGLLNAKVSSPPPPAEPESATLFVNVESVNVSVSVVMRHGLHLMSPDMKLIAAPLVPE